MLKSFPISALFSLPHSGQFPQPTEGALPYIEFQELKSRVSIEQAVQLLGLQLKPARTQLRGPCPICKIGGDRALVVTPSKGMFYCFAGQTGGDQIALVAHVKACKSDEAAAFLNSTSAGSVQNRTVTKNGATVPPTDSGKRQGLSTK
jgi:hypothetical protein